MRSLTCPERLVGGPVNSSYAGIVHEPEIDDAHANALADHLERQPGHVERVQDPGAPHVALVERPVGRGEDPEVAQPVDEPGATPARAASSARVRHDAQTGRSRPVSTS